MWKSLSSAGTAGIMIQQQTADIGYETVRSTPSGLFSAITFGCHSGGVWQDASATIRFAKPGQAASWATASLQIVGSSQLLAATDTQATALSKDKVRT